MPRLSICIMVHVEDLKDYDEEDAHQYALLSTRISSENNRGARMSWQFDVNYFKPAPDGAYPYATTSLRLLLTNGHNWWVHSHCATYEHLTTTWAHVCSAFELEKPLPWSAVDPRSHVIGRSGGPDLDNPVDWVSITAHRGLRAMNAPTQRNYDYTPLSCRPMGYSNSDIKALHSHDRAPGSTNDAFWTTLTHRPFWMDTASRWDLRTNTMTAIDPRSVLMLPHVSNYALDKLADRRSAFEGTSADQDLTTQDLNAALTQIWSTYQSATLLTSLNNIWYIHLPPAYCLTPYHNMVCGWVESINNIMGIGGGSPLAKWRNMNEIVSLAFNSTSRYW